eukprot:TRINITY_DN170_c0_g1_i14.p1 TRINITY_DN170_c0_g1~~TRINITY_DN170_c0_g1_i14.p1  ORF type:complete len:353 (-),score=149.96 TRINITY_DN170_c0_g1_i14:205-1233(-)
MGVQKWDHQVTNPLTMTRFLLAERMKFKDSTGSFSLLLQSIQLACKIIGNSVRKAGIANLFGAMGNDTNQSGDVQKKLDVLANEVFVNCLTFSDQVYILGSEELDKPIVLQESSGGYAVVFDPLDGSSNIDCNLSVGTIFGIYKKDPKHKTSARDILKPGTELIAAGYALYDAATMIVLSTGLGVNGFTLDPVLGEFILTHRDMKIPKTGKYYSINEGNSEQWDEPTKEFAKWCKKKGKGSRYVGSMVGDVHRTLLYGGTFAYPGDKKNANGKLRLIYECNPMSFIIEQAGGKATTGRQRVLELQPKALHQKCPIFLGSPEDITQVEQFYRAVPAPAPRSKL